MNIGSFLASARRILVVSKKPTRSEFITMAKITGLGIVIIAIIAFIVWFAINPVFRGS